jgi:predicted phage tail component-like protein
MRIVTFNGRQSSDPALGIKTWHRVYRSVLSGTRDRLLTIPGRDGVYDGGCDLEQIIIPCEFVLQAASPAEFRQRAREVAAWLNVRDAKELIFSDEPNLRYMARPTGPVDMEQIVSAGIVNVSFLVPAGYAEAVTATTVTGDSGNYAGTLPTPMIINLSATAGGTLTVTQGQHSTPMPFIKLVDQAFEGGEDVVIDTEKRLVTVDGVDARPDVDIESDFENFVPDPGAFKIGAQGGTVQNIVYRARFI